VKDERIHGRHETALSLSTNLPPRHSSTEPPLQRIGTPEIAPRTDRTGLGALAGARISLVLTVTAVTY